MTARLLAIGTIVTLVFGAGGLGYYGYDQNQKRQQLKSENALLSEEMKSLTEARNTLQSEVEKLTSTVDSLQKNVSDAKERAQALTLEKERISNAQQQLEQQMRKSLNSRDVTISQLKGKLTVSILDRVMFDSGKAELKPEGCEVLQQIATVLQNIPERQIMVIGHTDNVPVRYSKYLYPTNWELSTARATAAVRFFIDEAGIGPARLSAAGYGEHHPLADNSTPEGRARNRRIDIVIMPRPILEATASTD